MIISASFFLSSQNTFQQPLKLRDPVCFQASNNNEWTRNAACKVKRPSGSGRCTARRQGESVNM
jgi:hypothetical protein